MGFDRRPGRKDLHVEATRTPATQRRAGCKRALAAVALAAVPAIAGCEATVGAETSQEYTPGQGVWANTDGLQLRGIVAVAARDGSATLVGTIFNRGRAGDALVGVAFPQGRSSLGAGSVRLPAGGIRVLGVGTSQGKATRTSLSGASLKPGFVVPMTFDFQRAGSITLDVLVVRNEGPFATVPVPSSRPAKPAAP